MQKEKQTKLEAVKDDFPKKPRSDTEIVTALRGDDPVMRKLALEELFPLTNGALLINALRDGNQITATDKLDAPRCFGAILYVAVQLGRFLGMELNWTAPNRNSEQPGIEVVPGDGLPR
jgi:hypothetical protein